MSRRQVADEVYLIIGLEIGRLREGIGLTQRQLAKRIGVAQNIVSDIELGLRQPDRHLVRLAEVFRVPVTHFTSLVEPCSHCAGTGLLHGDQSRAITLRRALLGARPVKTGAP